MAKSLTNKLSQRIYKALEQNIGKEITPDLIQQIKDITFLTIQSHENKGSAGTYKKG